MRQGGRVPAGGSPEAESPRFRVLTPRKLLELPQPTWLATDLLPADGLAMLYGQSGSGKTFLALDLGLSIASGASSWLGRPLNHRGAVIYVAAEGAHSLRARLEAWCLHHGNVEDEIVLFSTVPDAVNLFDPMDVAELIRTLEDDAAASTPARLTVIDTLSRCSPGVRENLQEDASRIIENVEAIRAATGGLVLLLHHTGKNSEAERGSSVFRGAMDAMLHIADEDTHRVLKVTKQRDGEHLDPIPFVLAPRWGSLIVAAGAASGQNSHGPTQRERNALRELIDVCPADGDVTRQTWREASDQPPRSFGRVIKQLTDKGLVLRASRGRYQPAPGAESMLQPRPPA